MKRNVKGVLAPCSVECCGVASGKLVLFNEGYLKSLSRQMGCRAEAPQTATNDHHRQFFFVLDPGCHRLRPDVIHTYEKEGRPPFYLFWHLINGVSYDQPMHLPSALLLVSISSSTGLPASAFTVMVKSQSGLKQPAGMVKKRLTESPCARGSVI